MSVAISRAVETILPAEVLAADPVARARALVPHIAAAGPRIEATRELPPELLAMLHEARMFRTLMPRAFGGEEISPQAYVQMMIHIASADASTAWCVGQASGCSMAAAYMEAEAAQAIWGAPNAALAWGTVGPDQIAQVVDGGYRVTGTWPFASGGRHATWFGGHCRVRERDGSMRMTAEGTPYERTMMFPRSSISMVDRWQVMGLRGTGSDSYEVTDLFVPEEHTYTRDTPADRRAHTPLHSNFTGFNIFGLSFSALALGVARGMMQDFVTLASQKSPQSAQGAWLLRDNAVVQSKVAIAEARLMAARGMVADIYGRLWDQALQGRPFTLRDKADMRLASTFAMNEGREVVAVLYNAAGGTAIFQKNSFERRFRDVNCASQQGQAAQAHFEIIGQVLLGLEPKGRV